MQYAARAGEREDVAELIEIFAQISALVLRTPQGACRYLSGAPLRFNTLALVGQVGVGPGVPSGPFAFLAECFPYLPRVMGLEDIVF
jgi:hypothetical protein